MGSEMLGENAMSISHRAHLQHLIWQRPFWSCVHSVAKEQKCQHLFRALVVTSAG